MLISLMSNFILVRLLEPEIFGVFALLAIGISLSELVVNAGIGQYLIFNKDSDELDFSTLAIANCAMGLTIFCLYQLLAGQFSILLTIEDYMLELRVFGAILIINSFSIAQRVRAQKTMQFKGLAMCTIVSVFVASLVAIVLAFWGFTVKALVFRNLAQGICLNLALLVVFGFQTPTKFSWVRLRPMLSFGLPVMGKGSLFLIYEKAIETLVARNFGVEMVGFYTKSRELPNISNAIVSKSITRVSFSDLNELPSKTLGAQVKYRRHFNFAALGMALLSLIFAGGAHYISGFFYGDGWSALTPMMVLFGLSLGIQAMTNFYHAVMKNFDMTRMSLFIFAGKAICHGLFLILFEFSFEEILYSMAVFNLAELVAVLLALGKKLERSVAADVLTLCILIGVVVLAANKGDLSAGGFGWWMFCFLVWSIVALKAFGHELKECILPG